MTADIPDAALPDRGDEFNQITWAVAPMALGRCFVLIGWTRDAGVSNAGISFYAQPAARHTMRQM
ncbi:hypothetical protein [Rhizobium binxianense]